MNVSILIPGGVDPEHGAQPGGDVRLGLAAALARYRARALLQHAQQDQAGERGAELHREDGARPRRLRHGGAGQVARQEGRHQGHGEGGGREDGQEEELLGGRAAGQELGAQKYCSCFRRVRQGQSVSC